MQDRSPEMLKPTLIGGAAAGVAGGLPLLGCLCCALMAGGGFLASYLYSRESSAAGVEFRPGGGAKVGLVAGLFYALAATVVGGLVQLVMGAPDIDGIISQMEEAGLPPDALDTAARFMESSAGITGLVIGFFINLLLAAIFSTVGGLIGGSVFKVEAAPPAPPSDSPGNLPPSPPIE